MTAHVADPLAAKHGLRKSSAACLGVVLVGIAIFVGVTTWVNWVKYVTLRSTWAYDLGGFNNEAFNQVTGRDVTYVWIQSWFAPEDFEGPSIFRSNHFSPLRLFLVPYGYRLWPQITTLMVIQSLLIGIGAVALYRVGYERLGRPAIGCLLAACYLAHPAILHQGFNDFRDIALGIGPGLLALWLHASGRPVAFVGAAIVMLAARSEYIFLLAAFPIMNWKLRPAGPAARTWVGLPLALAVLWAVLSEAYYRYLYDVAWPLLTYGVYAGGPGGGLKPVERLARLLVHLPRFARIMLLPGVVSLGAPEGLAVAAPFVAQAGSVHWPAFPHHNLQHLSPAMVAIFWAFAVSVIRWWPWVSRTSRREILVCLILMFAAGASLAHFAVRVVRTYVSDGIPRHREIASLADGLPADATVLVPMDLVARFSHHTRVLTYQHLPLPYRPLSAEARREALVAIVAVADVVVIERDPMLEQVVAESRLFGGPVQASGYRLFVRSDVPVHAPEADWRLQRSLHWEKLKPYQRRWATLSLVD